MRADDEDAYVEYVSARRDWLRRFAYRLCGDWHRADDLAQQVCERLYVYWHKATGADTIDAYVRQMTVHAWLTEQRRGWFRRVGITDAVPDRPVDAPDPGRRLDVLDALAHLAPGHRAVLVLRFWEQLSVAETAALLRCAEGTVKSQTAHGLAALRKRLPGYAGHSLEES